MPTLLSDCPTEENLVLQQLAQDNLKAFDCIYLRYSDLLLAQTIRLVKNQLVAEDIIQEIFIRLWERRTSFAGYSSISGWLFLSAFNASMNYLKRQVNESRRHIAFEQEKAAADPHEFALAEARYLLMEKAINQLPPQRKQVFTLCKLDGLSYDEAAEKLSISKNTVKDHIKKAHESIRHFILHEKDQPLAVAAILLLYKMF